MEKVLEFRQHMEEADHHTEEVNRYHEEAQRQRDEMLRHMEEARRACREMRGILQGAPVEVFDVPWVRDLSSHLREWESSTHVTDPETGEVLDDDDEPDQALD
jgi:hypothetical protein